MRGCRERVLGVAIASASLVVVTVAHPAAAQQPSTVQIAQARELFDSAVAATHRGAWDLARQSFARAYEVFPTPLTLFNLASAEVQTGHVVAGVEHYRQFLAQAASGPAASHRDEAQQALDAAEPRIAHLEISLADARESDRVALDGQLIHPAVVGAPIPVDPGPHTLELSRDARVVHRVTFDIAPGASHAARLGPDAGARVTAGIALDPPRRVAPEVLRAAPRSAVPRRSVFVSPWFWGITGGVLVLSAGVVVGTLLGVPHPAQGDLSPPSGTVR